MITPAYDTDVRRVAKQQQQPPFKPGHLKRRHFRFACEVRRDVSLLLTRDRVDLYSCAAVLAPQCTQQQHCL